MRLLLASLAVVAAAVPVVTSTAGQVYPGQMTQARVWVQNRGSAEAVPVEVREWNPSTPVRVQIVNGDSSTSIPAAPMRQVRQQWEYTTVAVEAGSDSAATLNERGKEGWETTGIAWSAGSTTTMLLKRPK